MLPTLIAAVLSLIIGTPTNPSDDLSLGDPAAKIQVDLYASPTCIHCANFVNGVFPAFKAKYVNTGRVHFTLHEFVTPPDVVSEAEWITARCAGPEKYFQVIEEFFRNQAKIFEASDTYAILLEVAKSAGLSETQVLVCLDDPAKRAALKRRVDTAWAGGIDSFPTFLINGVKFEGEMSLAQLDRAIAAAKVVP